MLNIPLANGNPNAIIVAAFNITASITTIGVITIYYDANGTLCNANGTPGRWLLNVDNGDAKAALFLGQQFNIIVMNPT